MPEFVSVLLPVKNGEFTIKDSISSVLNQSHLNLELIVIINDTTDNTEKVINSINDDRIRIIHSQPGLVSALNAGLREAKYEIIARQDCDDIWFDFKLEKQLSVLKNRNVDILGTQMEINSSSNGKSITNYPINHEECLSWLFEAKNPIGHPSVIFRKKIIDKVGGYWDIFPFAEDMDFWMRSIPFYKLGNCDFIGMRYNHIHNVSYNPKIPQIISHHYRNLYGVK